MRSSSRASLLFAMACCTLAEPGAARAGDPTVVRGDLGAQLDRFLTRLEAFGYAGAAGVWKDGEVVLEKGYGPADRDSGRRVAADTVFTVGSITKQFTGAAILLLQDRGLLSVDDPIADYFDGVPEDKREITIHELLTHTAGFPGAIGDDFENPTRDEFLRQALATDLLFEPGDRYEYSNVGFSLAAIIVEMVSNKPYETFLHDELFAPAGMTRTGYNLPQYRPDEVAVGYREGERWGTFLERESFVTGPSWHLKGNGGIQSTVGDMLRWHQATLAPGLLSADAIDAWTTRWVREGFDDSYYGYGWSLASTPWGTRLVTHNGGNGVFSADFRRYVDDGVAVYATSARAEDVADHVTRGLSMIAFGRDFELPPEVIAVPPAALDDLCGTYAGGDSDAVTVSRQDDHLLLEATGDAAAGLVLGGSGRPGPREQAIGRRSLAIVSAWIEGDVGPLAEATGGGMDRSELERSIAEFRRAREAEYGPMRSAEVARVQRAPFGVRVLLVIHHERGDPALAFDWEGDEIAGIDPMRAIPPAEAEVHPLGKGAFSSFRLGSPQRVQVRFEDDAEGRTLVFVAGGEEVRFRRRN